MGFGSANYIDFFLESNVTQLSKMCPPLSAGDFIMIYVGASRQAWCIVFV
jgi:hypothetical protein